MPWADQSREDTAAFVGRAVDDWGSGESFNFVITSPDPHATSERILGGCGLHARCGPGALEIGYWLHPDATGRGIVTQAAAALTATAFDDIGVDRVEIHCDEANVRSAAVPQRLGFELARIEPRPVTAPGEHGRQMIWVRRADRSRPAGPNRQRPG
jgi:RimJ/RimL family protein N-acetyltransferase